MKQEGLCADAPTFFEGGDKPIGLLGLAFERGETWNFPRSNHQRISRIVGDDDRSLPIADIQQVDRRTAPTEVAERWRAEISNWRPHGDSNPGYRRERAVS